MNQYDRRNFEFIMTLNEEEFDEFFSSVGEDDIQYAIELIQEARSELIQKELEYLDQVEDVSQASVVLKQFTLNK